MNSLIHSWLQMWFFPRKTINHIITTKPHYGLFLLAFITGSPSIFRSFFLERTTVNVNSMAGLIISLILSFIWGYIMFYYFGWFLFRTQKWFQKREAPYIFYRTAFAWSSIPSSIICIFWLIIFFISEFINPIIFSKHQIDWINIFTIAMGIWTFILLIGSVSTIDRSSLGKSILHTITAVFLGLLCMVVIGLIISLFIPFLLSTL